MGNLLCWLIRKLLNPYLGQLVVYKPRATPSVYKQLITSVGSIILTYDLVFKICMIVSLQTQLCLISIHRSLLSREIRTLRVQFPSGAQKHFSQFAIKLVHYKK